MHYYNKIRLTPEIRYFHLELSGKLWKLKNVATAINQSISQREICRVTLYDTTRPGAPTVVIGKHDQKVHS